MLITDDFIEVCKLLNDLEYIFPSSRSLLTSVQKLISKPIYHDWSVCNDHWGINIIDHKNFISADDFETFLFFKPTYKEAQIFRTQEVVRVSLKNLRLSTTVKETLELALSCLVDTSRKNNGARGLMSEILAKTGYTEKYLFDEQLNYVKGHLSCTQKN